MLSNYVVVAIRRLLGAPLYSFVNALGLGLGLSCFILTILFVNDEYAHDAMWPRAGDLYRVEMSVTPEQGDRAAQTTFSYPGVAPLAQANLDDFDALARLNSMQFLVSAEQNRSYERVAFVDPDITEVFGLKSIVGDAREQLAIPMTGFLTESAARKYFGTTEVVDRYIQLDTAHHVRVAGVLEELPDATHLQLGVVVSLSSLEQMYENENGDLNQWRFANLTTYVRTAPGVDPDAAAARLTAFAAANAPDQDGRRQTFTLAPVTEIHRRATNSSGINVHAMLSVLAALVLLMACVNTVNLTTARGVERYKELGVRKALGATRTQLASQILAESVILAFVALILGLAITGLALPWFNTVTDKTLSLNPFTDPWLAFEIITATAATGLLAGAYPALIFSRSRPLGVLAGADSGRGSFAFRRALVVLQFAVAIGFAIATHLLTAQMRYVQNIDLGFDKENVVVVANMDWTDIRPRYEALRQEFLRHPDIIEAAGSLSVPGREVDRPTAFRVSDAATGEATLNRMLVDYEFFRAYGIEAAAGRLFSRELGGDEVAWGQTEGREFAAIINMSALRRLGFTAPEDAIDKALTSPDFQFSFRIVGVVNDFHILAGRGEIQPYIYYVSPGSSAFLSLRLAGRDTRGALEHIDRTWAALAPEYPIVRTFLEDALDASFAQWERISSVMVLTSALAILIAAIGSFSLAAYTVKSRKNEISMRKILGASRLDIVQLLTTEFGRSVLMANLIAWPIAYFIMQRWLAGLAYRIDIGVAPFLIVGLVSIAASVLIVGYHAVRVAQTSPAQTLRQL